MIRIHVSDIDKKYIDREKIFASICLNINSSDSGKGGGK